MRDHKPRGRDQQFLRDQGCGCNIIVGSGTKLCHAFRIKDRYLGTKRPKMGSAMENHTSL